MRILMKTKQLIVVEPGRIELQENDFDETLRSNEALIRSEYSVVSAGTEGAGFTGLVKEMPFGDGGHYPRGTGYGNLGKVLAVGDAVSMCKPGDRVLSFSQHASVHLCRVWICTTPMDPRLGKSCFYPRNRAQSNQDTDGQIR